MTRTGQPPQQPRTSAPSWREAALARSEIITDAWEVTKTYAGRIAEWVLFLCMVMNIIEILVTLPLALSNIVLGTQVVMLDVGGFSLASMGDHAREQGNERAARRASITGYFLIAVTIVTLLLVTVGLLWSPARPYTDGAEKGLILVRVVMTVIYAHVIHGLRRATAHSQPTPNQVEELAMAFNQQLQELSSELSRVQESFHFQLSSELATLRENFHRQLSSELSPVHESLQHFQETLASIPAMQARLHHLESSPVVETHKQPVLRALPSIRQDRSDASQTHRAKETRQAARHVTGFDARAFVFACLSENPDLKLAEIEQLAHVAGQELSQPTASRYRKQFFNTGESPDESSASSERKVVGE